MHNVQALSEEDQSMLPRLAHLEDKLEKKDKTIFKLKKENDSLKVCKDNLHSFLCCDNI